MFYKTQRNSFIKSLFGFISLIAFILIIVSVIEHTFVYKNPDSELHSHTKNTHNNITYTTLLPGPTKQGIQHISLLSNATLETTIHCVGPLYNQSCLFKNLYYVDGGFMILTVKGSVLPSHAVRTGAFLFWNYSPNKRVFDTYVDLEKFVRRIIYPKVIPSLTVYFGQPWHFNIGHALFDGLYPAYLALIRFPPRHLYPFRFMARLDDCNDCWSEDIYSRFAGLGLIKQSVLNKLSNGRWFMFDELIMGSGTLCQRCHQPHLQLAGGVELDGSRLFRDRMYHQHGLLPSIARHKSSSEHRTSNDTLSAYIIDNKRYTDDDRKKINAAINEINNYTNLYRNQPTNPTIKPKYPLIDVTYLYYNRIRPQNINVTQINATAIDARSPTYELVDNNFIAQLKILQKMDIHISGPGTGQMYQTFLSDGSVHINLGGLRVSDTGVVYTSYMEQSMTSGTPYIKGLYYPINERTKGIKKDEVVKLIRQAGEMIMKGFALPVNPRENLGVDGQLFVEMCEKDEAFCSLVTKRLPETAFECIDLWVEDFINEHRQWKLEGITNNGRNIICPFNHTLLHELRLKYGIKQKQSNSP